MMWAQNLLPNGNFEQIGSPDFSFPFFAFDELAFWYAASYSNADSTFSGTPDLFSDKFPREIREPISFWNISIGAAEGDHYLGMYNEVRYEGYFTPEAIGSSLTQALEPGAYYAIEFKVRNKGIRNPFSPPIFCVQDPYKKVDIFLHSDSIFLLHDAQQKNSYANIPANLSIRSEYMTYENLVEWTSAGSCFQAEGGEAFLALAMASGRFEVEPPCEILDEYWDTFYVYYFDFDDIRLTKLPEEINLSLQICNGRDNRINIDEMANLPTMQDEIQYIWEDGTIDSIKIIQKEGLYRIDAILDCTTIPIYLEVTDSKCDPKIFVPNAFSPNLDGINDVLLPYIAVEATILNYEFSVFDRWGNRIFRSSDVNEAWNGNFKNQPLTEGNFIWLLEFEIDDPDLGLLRYTEKGLTTLLR